MEQFNSVVNKNLSWVHQNKYVLPVLSLFLGMYAALARPTLPNFIGKLFENPIFRLVMITYIIYRGNEDPQLALMIAAAFLITMHMINKKQVEKLSGHLGGSCSGGVDLETGNPCAHSNEQKLNGSCSGGVDLETGNPCAHSNKQKLNGSCSGGVDLETGNPC